MHSQEPWVGGAWEQEYRGKKLFYVFKTSPEDIHSEIQVWSGVKDGDSHHCSKKPPGKVVIGMEFDYSNSSMTFDDDDIKRTVACVNACAGFSTEELEMLLEHNGTLAHFITVSPEDAEIIRNSPEKGGTSGFTTIPPDSSIAEVIARQMIEEEKTP